ncbi:MAG: hypothetical protein ACKVSF_15905 [Alphaproteobacteria bacterium]
MSKTEPENGVRGDAGALAPPAGPPAPTSPAEQILALAIARFTSAPTDSAPEANLKTAEIRGNIPQLTLGAVAALLVRIHSAAPTDAAENR